MSANRLQDASRKLLLPVRHQLKAGGLLFTLVMGLLCGHAQAIPLTVLNATDNALFSIDSAILGAPSKIGDIIAPRSPAVPPDYAALVRVGNGTLYTYDRSRNELVTLDASNANFLAFVDVPHSIHQTRGFDISPSGTLYGVILMQLYTIDPSNGRTTLVGPITGGMGVEAIAFDGVGNLYAAGSPIARDPSQTLYQLDPVTAALSLISDLLVPDLDTLTVGEDGFLYGTDSQAGEIADLYQINPNSGAVMNLGPTGVFEVNGIAGVAAPGFLAQVPEPTTLALMVLGLAGLGFSRRKAA